jgi:hypothetical protein
LNDISQWFVTQETSENSSFRKFNDNQNDVASMPKPVAVAKSKYFNAHINENMNTYETIESDDTKTNNNNNIIEEEIKSKHIKNIPSGKECIFEEVNIGNNSNLN